MFPFLFGLSAPKSGFSTFGAARGAMRIEGYSIRTAQSYLGEVRRFLLFQDQRRPKEMEADETETETYLAYLAMERYVGASAYDQASGL